jgi:hypothetical protein
VSAPCLQLLKAETGGRLLVEALVPDFQVRLLAGSVRLAPVQCGALAVGPDTRVLTLPTCACESATSPHPQGNRDSIRQVATSGLDVFAHNVETVQRLQPVVRDRRANWAQSLGVLAAAKDAGASITKTSIMLGCGEHQEEVRGPWFTCLRHCCSMAPVGCFVRPPRHVQQHYTPRPFCTTPVHRCWLRLRRCGRTAWTC